VPSADTVPARGLPFTEDAVTYVFDEGGFYVRLANRTIDGVPWYHPVRYRRHGLCACLNLDVCPARADVVKAYAAPFLAEELTAFVADLRAGS
jgi:hypothetical protein